MDIRWSNETSLGSQEYTCGHCGKLVGSDKGFHSNDKLEGDLARIFICPHCARPTFFHKGKQTPDVAPGKNVEHVPTNVNSLYNEARRCISCSAYTSSVLSCRKLLMNIAVAQGAAEGLNFIEYIDYLAIKGYVPPNGKGWVDHIRKKGNEATHEISPMTHDDANELVSFAEMLLKFIYEFPAKVPKGGMGEVH